MIVQWGEKCITVTQPLILQALPKSRAFRLFSFVPLEQKEYLASVDEGANHLKLRGNVLSHSDTWA